MSDESTMLFVAVWHRPGSHVGEQSQETLRDDPRQAAAEKRHNHPEHQVTPGRQPSKRIQP